MAFNLIGEPQKATNNGKQVVRLKLELKLIDFGRCLQISRDDWVQASRDRDFRRAVSAETDEMQFESYVMDYDKLK